MPLSSQMQTRAFAAMVNGVLGCQARIVIGGSVPCTNGTTIFFPDRGFVSDADFRTICGVVLHEAAHIYFQSVPIMTKFVDGFAAPRRLRAKHCFNMVIDIADETRLSGRVLAGAEDYLQHKDVELFNYARKRRLLPKRPRKVKLEQFAMAAMLVARARPNSPIPSHLARWPDVVPGFSTATRLLKLAADRSKSSNSAHAVRGDRQWNQICRLARHLMELMDRFYPITEPKTALPRGSQADLLQRFTTQIVKVVIRRSIAPSAFENGSGKPTPPPVRDSPLPSAPPPVPTPGPEPDPAPVAHPSADSRLRSFIRNLLSPSPVSFDEQIYQNVLPELRRRIVPMTLAASTVIEDGHFAGRRMSRPHRAMIDGRAFRRAAFEEAPDAAVALLIDHSISMHVHMSKFLPVGAAMADALASVPQVSTAIWRFGSTVERVSTSDLRHGHLMGATATDEALAAARDWLKKVDAARRVVVLFTDGVPNHEDRTEAESIQLRRLGITLMVGSIGVGLTLCAKAFPNGVVFDVDPSRAALSVSTAIGRIATTA